MLDRLLEALTPRNGSPGPLRRSIGSWMLRSLPGMLTCEELEGFVHDYVEQALDARSRARFERHLRLCPMCRVHFDEYVRTIALGQQLCEDDDRLPEGMPEELVGAILTARRRAQGSSEQEEGR